MAAPAKRAARIQFPSLEYEKALWAQGICYLAGIDEVGRGALAGPVYAAAVVLPSHETILKELHGVRDSKQMRPAEREEWAPRIQEWALAWGIGWASSKEIDRYGIAPATKLASRRAIKKLAVQPEHLLLDYIRLEKVALPQTSLKHGDALCLSIAAASVIAKVARDAELCLLDQDYPLYGLAGHKGYATAEHRLAIQRHGPSPQHRRSFSPMRFA